MLNFKNIKKEFTSGNVLRRVGSFLSGNIKKFVFALFLLSAIYCGYIWYGYIYNPRWSPEKAAEYLKTKDKEVTFNRKKFQDIMGKANNRADEYVKPIDGVADIFKLK